MRGATRTENSKIKTKKIDLKSLLMQIFSSHTRCEKKAICSFDKFYVKFVSEMTNKSTMLRRIYSLIRISNNSTNNFFYFIFFYALPLAAFALQFYLVLFYFFFSFVMNCVCCCDSFLYEPNICYVFFFYSKLFAVTIAAYCKSIQFAAQLLCVCV